MMAPESQLDDVRGTGHLADRLGALAGALCAVHCAATIPAAGLLSTDLAAILGHELELFLFSIAAVLLVISAVHGYRHHRSLGIMAAFALCVVTWLVGTFAAPEPLEGVLHVGAAIGLATTHLVSLRRIRSTCAH